MKVGDILILADDIKWRDQPYTAGKHYPIFKIEYQNIQNTIRKIGYIFNDNGDYVCFSEEHAAIDGWEYLHKLRKQKLEKLKSEKL